MSTKRRGTKGDSADGIEHVAAYHKELQLCLREHESKFDNAVLLAAGGAFTISAAFISDLGSPLSAGPWLAVSWFAWALCLLAGVGGHLVGAHATKRVLALLDSQNYDRQELMSGKAAKLIQPLNVATFVLLLAGFIAFGRFTFANLDFGGGHGDSEKKERVISEGQQEGAGVRLRLPGDGGRENGIREQRPSAGSTVAAPQTNESQVRSSDDRQEDTANTTTDPSAGTTAAGSDSRHPAQPASADGAAAHENAQRAQSASGLATAGQEVTSSTDATRR